MSATKSKQGPDTGEILVLVGISADGSGPQHFTLHDYGVTGLTGQTTENLVLSVAVLRDLADGIHKYLGENREVH